MTSFVSAVSVVTAGATFPLAAADASTGEAVLAPEKAEVTMLA
jgi:hypothetical protein